MERARADSRNVTILACDLGGTRLKIGVVRQGVVLAQTVEPANSKRGLSPQLPLLKAAWLRLLASLGLTAVECAGISIAFPSLVNPFSSMVLAEYGKFSDAVGMDLRSWAWQEMRLPLAIENDARMALVGEWNHGAGRGSEDLVMMTLGTGLGTAAIIEGRLLRGKHYQAGVLGGHITVRFDGRLCACGNVGCAETEASTACLAEMSKASPNFDGSALAREPVLDFAAVFKQARAGDECALALRDHSMRVWASLAVSLVHAYDPEKVILGGGVMASGDVILPFIQDYVLRHANAPRGSMPVAASELGDDAALVAGEWLLKEQFPNLQL